MRSKTSAALLLVSLFLLGGVAGAALQYVYRNHMVSAAMPRPRLANSHDIVDEMALSLELDTGQKEQLRGIIQQSRDRYRTLSRQFQPQYEQIRGETNEAIRAILRPGQRQQFDDTLEKMDRRHQDHTHQAAPPPSK